MTLKLLPVICSQNLITVSASYILEVKNQTGSAQEKYMSYKFFKEMQIILSDQV